MMPAPIMDPISFQNINADSNFTGRSTELTILDVNCQAPPHIVVVTGLGGIGKTQLVRKFADNQRAITSSQNIIWINSNKIGSIEADFATLATSNLSLSTRNADGKQKDFKLMFAEVLAKLCKLPTFIMLDNVDDENTRKFVLEFVLGIGTSGHTPRFVITSRLQSWTKASMYVMQMKRLTDADAAQLVTNILIDEGSIHNDSPADVKKLVDLLQNFPLTLRQATSYINYQRVDEKFYISDYIDQYNSLKLEYLNSDFFKEEIGFKYNETTYTTWRVTLSAIAKCKGTGDLALRIIRIIAYFDPNQIRRDIFFNLTTNASTSDKIDTKDVKSAVRLLVNYSMIEGRQNQYILSIHRLVQEVIKMETLDAGTSVLILHDGLKILAEMYAHNQFNGTLEHGISVFTSASLHNELIVEFSYFPSEVLFNLNDGAQYYQAKSFGDEILPRVNATLGKDHSDALTAKSHTAISYSQVGHYAESLQMFEEVHEMVKDIFGEEHPVTIETKHDIAATYREMGKLNETLQTIQAIYETQSNIFGKEHSETLKSKSCIGLLHGELGKHNEALRIHQDVYEKRSNILGENDGEMIECLSNIAWTYRELGKHTEALEMYRDSYERRKNFFGEDHARTIECEFDIAATYRDMGEYVVALRKFEEVHDRQITVIGEKHSETLKAESNIAYLHRELGNPTEALRLYQDLCKKRKNIIGENHADTIRCKSNISSTYSELGEHAEALKMCEEVYEKLKNIIGKDHADTIRSKSNIASLHCELGEYTEAIRIYEEVYEQRKSVLGQDHPDTIVTMSHMEKLQQQLEQHADEDNGEWISNANIAEYYTMEPIFFL